MTHTETETHGLEERQTHKDTCKTHRTTDADPTEKGRDMSWRAEGHRVVKRDKRYPETDWWRNETHTWNTQNTPR